MNTDRASLHCNAAMPTRRSHRRSKPLVPALAAIAITVTAACSGPPDKPAPATNAISNTIGAIRADNDMLNVLNAYAGLDPKAVEKVDVASARGNPTIADAVNTVLVQSGKSTAPTALIPGVTAVDRNVPGATGLLPARVYTPAGAGPFPVVLYFHGGGWVIADRQIYDAGARGLAHGAKAMVVSVDYRRAPEAKFPAAWDDALATYTWLSKNAATLNGDPSRLALAGESAGGNLAVATAVAARARGLTMPRAVISVYPVAQTGSLNTPSYVENAIAKPLNRPMIEWFMDKLVRTPADKADTRLDLVNADLAGLPPVTIINAQIDPLRSDGEMLEDALQKAGVPVERKVYTGVTHEFFGTGAVVAKAREAQAYAAAQLQTAFAEVSVRTSTP